jgi:hypothetical protein
MQFLGLLAQQPESAAWKIRQADEALRIVFQEMVRCSWAEQWPVGLPELDGWMEGPEGGGKMPVPTGSAQARSPGWESRARWTAEPEWKSEIRVPKSDHHGTHGITRKGAGYTCYPNNRSGEPCILCNPFCSVSFRGVTAGFRLNYLVVPV